MGHVLSPLKSNSRMSAKPPKSHLMTYNIGRGETGVLTFEPYKSILLPHWRFRTVAIAKASSETLWQKFLEFYEQDDFVGMDMTRKFIQMGMTRAKRYANYKGGRKYEGGKEKGRQKEKSAGHAGKDEKEEASLVFRGVWERCKQHEGYLQLKNGFLAQQKEWRKLEKGDGLGKGDATTATRSKEAKCEENVQRVKLESD